MKNETRQKFNKLCESQARLSGVESAGQSFAVEPSVQQRLEEKMQKDSGFLKLINVIGVDEIEGEKILLGSGGTTAGRTDTNVRDRDPRVVGEDLAGSRYRCVSTEFDTRLRWNTLDAWAKFKDFQIRVRRMILRQQALDRIRIGFNGVRVVAQTNREENPNLEDVNVGWLQSLREHAPERVMSGVTYGKGQAHYQNVDALVMDAKDSLLEEHHRQDPGLVAIVGERIMSDKLFPLVNNYDQPTERNATDLVISQKRVGGLQAVKAPFFPANAILITTLDNLSIYFQNGSRRSYTVDNPKRKSVDFYDSSNDAYVVEDLGRACLIEDIKHEDLKG